jgi:hypothetical protein
MFKVTNTNDFDFIAGFDGKQYKFVAGAPVTCPDAATIHIFGLQESNKTAVVSRHGWCKPTDPVSKGLDILKNFKFVQLKPEYEAPPALIDHRPAPVVDQGDALGTDGLGASPDLQERKLNPLEAAAQANRLKQGARATA